VFKNSGAKYVVLTSKHHEGWTNWPSKYSWNWNSQNGGPHRDLVGELTSAVRAAGLHMGLYHSLFEWFHPLYLQDKANGFKTTDYVTQVTMPELREIVNAYKPEIIWSDGDWEADDTYWDSKNFLAWLFNESPVKDTVAVNDRWGSGDSCKHGGYYSCSDRYNPGTLQLHKWENAMTIDQHSWGFRRNAVISDYLDQQTLINELVSTVACGGNLLMNIGPTHDGVLIPIFQERLLGMGKWLGVNGEAIYSTTPWRAQNDTASSVWYTSKAQTVYAIALKWPDTGMLKLTVPKASANTTAYLLGDPTGKQLTIVADPSGTGLTITLPSLTVSQLPSLYAWTVKLSNVN